MGALLATTILPALLPAAGDAIRSVVGKFTGTAPAAPKTVGESIELMKAQTERMKALAEIDKPSGNAHRWVYDLRESSRYIAVFLIILNWIGQSAYGTDAATIVIAAELASSAVFFLFGDRVYMHLKKRS
jgi:hypothetical protein